jgi:hypothetical protein
MHPVKHTLCAILYSAQHAGYVLVIAIQLSV